MQVGAATVNNQTREIGYVVIKTKNVIVLNCKNPCSHVGFRCYEFRNRCFDDEITDFSGLIKARTLGF